MLHSGLPNLVGEKETLVRFLTSSSQFNSSSVKGSGFLPGRRDDKTSVFREIPIDNGTLQALANEHLTTATAKAVAVVRAQDVNDSGLAVRAQEPPLRHANIEDWPVDLSDPQLQKAKRKVAAAVLADLARLIRFEQ